VAELGDHLAGAVPVLLETPGEFGQDRLVLEAPQGRQFAEFVRDDADLVAGGDEGGG
jgi:hypothetical protein